jgi:hypothetical protein
MSFSKSCILTNTNLYFLGGILFSIILKMTLVESNHVAVIKYTKIQLCWPSSFISRAIQELDIDNKLHNYLKIMVILNNVFRPQKAMKKTIIKLYNTLTLPVLLYGSETWTINL